MTINRNREREVKYKSKADLPQDIQEGLEKIGYSFDRFLECVKWNSEASMREWYNVTMSNAGKTTKEHQDLLDKTKKVKGHPSLNEFQSKRIEAYLKSGLSIRDVQRAIHADNFEASYGTIKSIRKKISESVDDKGI
jgi:hypothetical protein